MCSCPPEGVLNGLEETIHLTEGENGILTTPFSAYPSGRIALETDKLTELEKSLLHRNDFVSDIIPFEKTNPAEVAYINNFRVFLDSYLTRNGYPFPKLQELERNKKLPSAYYGNFFIEEDGTPKLVDRSFVFPPEVNGGVFWQSVKSYYDPLFKAMPKFTPPSEANLRAPYRITVGIRNYITRDLSRIYLLPCYIQTRFCLQ